MTITISKSVMDEVYFENKAKLCELRIKQVGRDVDLHHVIDHPKGSEAFRLYLVKAMAAENLSFYLAVDRFDAMCANITKMYTEICKLKNKIEKNQAVIDSLGAGKTGFWGSNHVLSY